MKRILPWAPLLALLASGLTALASKPDAPGPLPTPFPQTRYQQMSARSPFAVSTATAAAAAATPGFAAQLYVDGVAHVGKTDFVAIKSRDPSQQDVIFLEVGKSTDDGLKVEGVKWSDEMGKSTVDVSKGGEKATLEFDEQTVKTPTAAPIPTQVRLPMLPGGRPINFPPQNGQFNRFFPQQPGQPMGPNQTPVMPNRRVRGVIQSPQ